MAYYSALVTLVSLIGCVIVVMVWLARATSEEPTPAQRRLMDTSDWLLKGAAGALMGILGCKI